MKSVINLLAGLTAHSIAEHAEGFVQPVPHYTEMLMVSIGNAVQKLSENLLCKTLLALFCRGDHGTFSSRNLVTAL